MPIGYSGAPRVTQNNMDSRLRRLSRSLTTGNNGTPLRTTLFSSEQFQYEASPNSANTNSRRPVMEIFSAEFKDADDAVVNSCVTAGFWNDCGFIELRCAADNTLVWGVNNTFGGGPDAIVYLGSTGFMKADNTAFTYDETLEQMKIYQSTANTTPMFVLENGGAGDAALAFIATGVSTWMVGLDNDSGDRFRITKGAGLDTAEVFTITGGFDFGFGINIPTVKMHVVDQAVTPSWSPAQGTVATFESNDASRAFVVILGNSAGQSELHFADEDAQSNHRIRVNHVDDSMQFRVNGIDGLFIDSAGNVGIRKDPDFSFNIYNDDSSSTPQVVAEQDGAGDATFGVLLTGIIGYTWGIDNSTTNDDFKLNFGNTLADTGLTITPSSLFGINQATPLSRLDVGGSLGLPITEVNVNTTLDATHHTLLVNTNSADRVVTLPAASGATRRIYNIKKIDTGANTVTVDGNAAEFIDGGGNTVIGSPYESVTVQSDGTQWWII